MPASRRGERLKKRWQVAVISRTRVKTVPSPDPTVIPDNPNWHRFKTACPFYRERWIGDGEQHEGRVVLYHVICLQNTPPETLAEQEYCMAARTMCWRLKAGKRAAV